MNKKINFVRKIILIISLLVFLYAAFSLIKIYLEYQAIDNTVQEIRETYITREDDGFLNIDWGSLLSRNEDVVGWIYIPNSNISFPILKGVDNNTYLHHDIDHNYSIAGSIFMEEVNSPDFSDLNTIIYGHNMRNGSKFADVNRYANGRIESLHPYIYIYLPDDTLKTYQIVSVNRIDTSSNLYHSFNNTKEEYYQIMSQGRVRGGNFKLEDITKILTLSTCGDFSATTEARSVIFAILKETMEL